MRAWAILFTIQSNFHKFIRSPRGINEQSIAWYKRNFHNMFLSLLVSISINVSDFCVTHSQNTNLVSFNSVNCLIHRLNVSHLNLRRSTKYTLWIIIWSFCQAFPFYVLRNHEINFSFLQPFTNSPNGHNTQFDRNECPKSLYTVKSSIRLLVYCVLFSRWYVNRTRCALVCRQTRRLLSIFCRIAMAIG